MRLRGFEHYNDFDLMICLKFDLMIISDSFWLVVASLRSIDIINLTNMLDLVSAKKNIADRFIPSRQPQKSFSRT